MLKTVVTDVDICVCGGGMAGICAAIQAARSGKTVALVQERPMLGGNASSEIRMWVCGAQAVNCRETGIIEEINLENLYRNPYKNYSIWDSILYGKVRNEDNIKLFLNTSICDVDLEGGKIKTVVAWQMTTETWQQINAKIFIDCTGDGIMGPLANAEYRMGREAPEEFNEIVSITERDTKTMGLSCLIQASKQRDDIDFIAPIWAKKVSDEEFNLRKPHMDSEYENFWYLELGGMGDSIADTEAVRDDLLALAYGFWDKIKNDSDIKDREKWKLEFIGFLPAKRESRRLIGPYILTQTDVRNGGHFDDNIAYGGWGLDDHDPRGFYHQGAPNEYGKVPDVYGIPYRCLYSANVENLMFAGRNISTTHAALSSTRVMMTCAVLGQAAGEGAAVAVEYEATPQGVYDFYLDELQQRLLRSDCFIPYLTREKGKPMQKARLKAEYETVASCVDRNHQLFGNGDNAVSVKSGEKITYTFDEACYVEIAHTVFDSDLNRETLPGSQCERYHSMRCNLFENSPKMCMPKTLVKSFDIEFVLRDGTVKTISFDNNIRRMNEIVIDECVKEISLIPKSTWGEGDTCRVFSFDLY